MWANYVMWSKLKPWRTGVAFNGLLTERTRKARAANNFDERQLAECGQYMRRADALYAIDFYLCITLANSCLT